MQRRYGGMVTAVLKGGLPASLPEDVRANLGIDEGLVRLSVGIENVDDLVAELEHALA